MVRILPYICYGVNVLHEFLLHLLFFGQEVFAFLISIIYWYFAFKTVCIDGFELIWCLVEVRFEWATLNLFFKFVHFILVVVPSLRCQFFENTHVSVCRLVPWWNLASLGGLAQLLHLGDLRILVIKFHLFLLTVNNWLFVLTKTCWHLAL